MKKTIQIDVRFARMILVDLKKLELMLEHSEDPMDRDCLPGVQLTTKNLEKQLTASQ